MTPEPDPGLVRDATALASRASEPAIVANIRFGTAGWTDPSLIKGHLFYPRGASSPRARLEHYARHFDLVEVDATYYTLLAPSVAERWLEWTPPSFRFDVKANPVLTGHPIDVSRLPADLRARLPVAEEGARRVYPKDLPADVTGEIEARFRAFVQTLHGAGRLGAVLLQFPPWMTATRGHAKDLEALLARWYDLPLAVEFRNRSWMATERRDRVLDLLAAARASYVGVDEPDVPLGGVPPLLAVTNPDLAVVRFHGHNAGGWRRGATVAQRFDYLYSPDELSAWVEPVKRLATQARNVHAVFNNCVRNYAILGAKGLSVLLERAPGEHPATSSGASESGGAKQP